MIDIEAEFRKAMGILGNTSSVAGSDEPLTLEKLRQAADLLKSAPKPPPTLRLSKYAPALGSVPPKSRPVSDDMRQMVEDIGPQKVPVAFVMDTPFGRMAVANPIHFKEGSNG